MDAVIAWAAYMAIGGAVAWLCRHQRREEDLVFWTAERVLYWPAYVLAHLIAWLKSP